MTLEELLACPSGVDLFEWDAMLEKQKKIRTQIRRYATQRDEAWDALQVLADEAGSDRYNKWKMKFDIAVIRIQRLQEELEYI